MPLWNFVAFNSDAASELMLLPAQRAIRTRDLNLWQKVFAGLFAKQSPKALIVGKPDLSMDRIPEESDFTLRRNLQFFVERLAEHRLQGNFPRARVWVCFEISWPRVLHYSSELEQMEIFKSQLIARQLKIADPFWCLESNSAVDCCYAPPEVVQSFAEQEARTGLFRNLTLRGDLQGEVKSLANELAAVGRLIESAAAQKLALYFREDGT